MLKSGSVTASTGETPSVLRRLWNRTAGAVSAPRFNLETPKEPLQFSSTDAYLFANEARRQTTYFEGGRENRKPWETLPLETAYEFVNRRDVLAARIYEYLGYETSQPRVAEVNSKKVVLRKRMDDWRDFRVGAELPNNSQFRQLLVISAFLGGRVDSHSVSQVDPDRFVLNSFLGTLGIKVKRRENKPDQYVEEGFTGKETIAEIMASTHLSSLPLEHPWRNLTPQDIHSLRQGFGSLSDSVITSLVKMSGFSSKETSQRLIDALIGRRDTILKDLENYLERSAVPEDVLANYKDIAHLIQDSKDRDLFDEGERQAYLERWQPEDVAKAEALLSDFAEGRIGDVELTSNIIRIFDVQNSSSSISWGANQLPGVLRKVIQKLEEGRSDSLDSIAKKILWPALTSDGPHHSAVLKVIREEYFGHHTDGLRRALDTVWEKASSRRAEIFAVIMRWFQKSGKEADLLSEILLLGILQNSMESAMRNEHALRRGLGFHNAERVNHDLEGASRSIKIFLEARIERSLTQNLNLEALSAAFLDMQYDSLGNRRYGDGISPLEAFGLDSTKKDSAADPLEGVVDYIIRQITRPQLGQ